MQRSGFCCRRSNSVAEENYYSSSRSVYVENNTAGTLKLDTRFLPPELSIVAGGLEVSSVAPHTKMRIFGLDQNIGVGKSGSSNVCEFTTCLKIGGVDAKLQLQEKLTGNITGSALKIRIFVSETKCTSWSYDNPVSLLFPGTDGHLYQITGIYGKDGEVNQVIYTITDRAYPVIMPQIEHIVVLMMENRSFDNILGWLYPKDEMPPMQFLPHGSPAVYDGLNAGEYANKHPHVNKGQPVFASRGTTSWKIGFETMSPFHTPPVCPGEEFKDVAEQISDEMQGFLSNFHRKVVETCKGSGESAASIMQSFSPEQVPVISSLAKSFAVSDAWFSSVPSQTWPNRSFLLSGSSNGNVNNDHIMGNSWHNLDTVFDILQKEHISWRVFKDSTLPSIVQAMHHQYLFDAGHFRHMDDFRRKCQQPYDSPTDDKLPRFSLIEPHFGLTELGNIVSDESYHPPYDVRSGENFLSETYESIRASPYVDKILFVLLFDEHGGTYDHVSPPSGAAPPYPGPIATDGSTFDFSVFGVRVPVVVMSSYIKSGTVFRSSTNVPFDHTSILSTLRDWLGLADAFAQSLSSPRIAAAPTLASLLTESVPRQWLALPTAPLPFKPTKPTSADKLTDLHQSLLIAAAGAKRKRVYSTEEKKELLKKLCTVGDVLKWKID